MDLNNEEIRAFDEVKVEFKGKIVGMDFYKHEILVEPDEKGRELFDTISIPASLVERESKTAEKRHFQNIICNERALNKWKLVWIDWKEKRMYFSKDPKEAWGEGWEVPGWTVSSEKPFTTVNTGYVRACFDAYGIKSTYDFIAPLNDELSMNEFLEKNASNASYSLAGFVHGAGVLYFGHGLSDVWSQISINGGIFTIIDREKVLE